MVLQRLNINSRTIIILLNNSFFYDSGRHRLVNEAIDNLKRKPFIGWGIAGDVICMEQYPHRIDIEILLDFGQIMGIIIICLLICLIIRGFLCAKENRIEYLVLLSCGLAPLFLSHSYLSEPFFWIFLGACISLARHNNSQEKRQRFFKLMYSGNIEVKERLRQHL